MPELKVVTTQQQKYALTGSIYQVLATLAVLRRTKAWDIIIFVLHTITFSSIFLLITRNHMNWLYSY